MNKPAQKLKALLEGLKIADIDDMLEKANVEDYALLGRQMGEYARLGARIQRDIEARKAAASKRIESTDSSRE